MATPTIPTFKVVIVGDGGVGKTTLVRQYLNLGFESKYIATLGVDVHPVTFNTSRGLVHLNMWDCAGQDKFRGLADRYYTNAQAAIGVFDATAFKTVKRAAKLLGDVRGVAGDIPSVLCCNKADTLDNQTRAGLDDVFELVLVSAKTELGVNTPIQTLLRKLMNDSELVVHGAAGKSAPPTRTLAIVTRDISMCHEKLYTAAAELGALTAELEKLNT